MGSGTLLLSCGWEVDCAKAVATPAAKTARDKTANAIRIAFLMVLASVILGRNCFSEALRHSKTENYKRYDDNRNSFCDSHNLFKSEKAAWLYLM